MRQALIRSNTTVVDAYASRVVRREIPAGKYHRLSAVRHERDRAREGSAGFPYVFDEAQAQLFFRFAAKMKHYSGKQFSGHPIFLSESQQFRLGSLFGWRHKDTGLRRFTTSYNELPRKYGKTLEAAIVGLYVTFFEGEPGAEGYCIATKRDQAKRVFEAMHQLVRASGLQSRLAVLVNSIHRQETHQKLQPLGADADSTDGLNPYLIVTDEYHAFKHRDLVDVMISATGARESFLHYIITTAGDDPVSPCGDEHEFACQILDGLLSDDEATEAYFAFIAHADVEDDWKDPKTWVKANPHIGVSVDIETVRKHCLEAQHTPSKSAEFKQKRLNLWVNTSAPSLSIDGWRKGQSDWTEEEMHGQPCFVGLDLSMKLDLTSLSLLFVPTPTRKTFRVIQRIWTPAETLLDRAHRDRAPYTIWTQTGPNPGQTWLRPMPGVSIKQSMLQDELNALRKIFKIQMVGYDEWHADKLIEDMKEHDGWTDEQLLVVPQSFAGLTSAESRIKAEVLAGNVDARRCPVTAWAVSNVVDQLDGKGNILFSKKTSRGRIDPVKSISNAMALWLRQPQPVEKKYEVMFFGGRT